MVTRELHATQAGLFSAVLVAFIVDSYELLCLRAQSTVLTTLPQISVQ